MNRANVRAAYLILLVTVASLASLALPVTRAQSPAAPGAAIRFDVKNMDKSIDPCVDFYRHACGGWMEANPIPSDQVRWGRFNQLADNNLLILRSILEKAAQPSASRTPAQQKIGDLYAACMDEAQVNKAGADPIQAQHKRIAKIKSRKDLIAAIAALHNEGIPALFSMSAAPDMHDAKSMIVFVDQGGLTLPDRDYYLKDDAKSKETREKYVAHVQKMLELMGDDVKVASASAAKILQLEKSLAGASMDRASRREPKNRDHKMSTGELATLAPNFLFDDYFKERGRPFSGALNNTNPDYFKKIDPLLDSIALDDWKLYLRWKVLNNAAPLLSKPFVDQNFAFNRAYLNGQKEDQPRWKRCTRIVDGTLGEALGQIYVEQNFSPELKASTLAMVHNIEKAMSEDFKALPWMSDTTKKQAQIKLDAIRNHIGYPDTWRDYSTVAIKRGDLYGNVARADAFEVKRRLDKIGRPIDRDEWSITPPTVNANYRASLNDINFPAGILQPPFYDKSAGDAVNYGAIGVVIGHELTHGFDDQGSQFDADGNFKSWWTPEDRAEFDKRTGCISDQYAGFVAVDDIKLNGKLTLGENTADNGGAKIAFMGLQYALEGQDRAPIDGLTPEQRFFLGFAQIWCQNVTPENSRVLAVTDPHAPGKYRVNGVVQNSAEFQEAFSCQAGQPMVSANPCRVW